MSDPVVKLRGKCILHVDTGISTSKIEIPKTNPKTGENNADVFINQVLHFAIMRHGKNKFREMVEKKLSLYESKYDDCGITLENGND